MGPVRFILINSAKHFMVKSALNQKPKKGMLIAAVGIPGAGKSSIIKELALLLKGRAFFEPEEQEWPDAVRERDKCGRFTCLNWFRSQRVPQLYQAARITASGKIALIDAYFDKLFIKYMRDESWHWLISPKDPYFPIAEEIGKLDYEYLPDANVVVALKVSKDIWPEFLRIRARELDNIPGVRESIIGQESMLQAAKEFCNEKGAILVEYEQKLSSPKQAAKEIFDLIQKKTKNLHS